MGANLIALAVPMFFVLIGLEALWSALRKKKLYRLNDSINDLSCGMMHQITNVAFQVVLFAAYVWLYEHTALLTITADSVLAWVAIVFAADLAFYWFHRLSHEINIFWNRHIKCNKLQN